MLKKSIEFILVVVLLMICACTRGKHVIYKEYYDNGELKYVSYFMGDDSFPVYCESYFENGQAEKIYQYNRDDYIENIYKSYYLDGRLKDSCEYKNGLCVHTIKHELPDVSNCYIMLKQDALPRKIYNNQVASLFRNDTVDFSIFMDGFPSETYQMYYKSTKDSHYSYVYGNPADLNYPYAVFTPSEKDTLSLHIMFPNDSGQIIIGQTPQIKFNFIVE